MKISTTSSLKVVEMNNIWKFFPGVIANKGIDVEFFSGEIHALLGENGAGKTTLMNILSGLYRPDKGTISIQGKETVFNSPSQAISAGIGMIHQNFRLVEKFTAAENILLGLKDSKWNISPSQLVKQVEQICDHYGLYVDPRAKIWQLSTGEQQRVEILKALSRGGQVLILDEPTAVLTPIEVDGLFKVLRNLALQGHTIIIITHKLNEIMDITDKVTVLRAGTKIETRFTNTCNCSLLAKLMIGHEIVLTKQRKKIDDGKLVLQLQNINLNNDRGLPALKDVDLEIREGEILGVAGVAGNGQKELAEVVSGIQFPEDGKILIDGIDVTGFPVSKFAKIGIGHIPQDRNAEGLVLGESVMHNAILRVYNRPPISRRGLRINSHLAKEYAKRIISEGDVRVPNISVTIRKLSGGNQQRLIVRREVDIATRLLIAAHPTRGLDVASTNDVQGALIEYRNSGKAVLLISEDLEEILALSDRIVVMYKGRIAGRFSGPIFNREEIGLAMGGACNPDNQSIIPC